MRALVARRLCFAVFFALFLAGCGTPGAPQPPSLNLAKPVADLKATRDGSNVNLSWTVPAQTTDGANFRHRGATKICQGVDQASLNSCTGAVTLPTPAAKKIATTTVAIPQGAGGPTDYITYAVEVDNDRGRSAGLSNQVQIPSVEVSRLNSNASTQLTSDAVLVTVRLTLEGPAISQSLELHRKEQGTTQDLTVAQRPIDSIIPGEAANFELRDDTFAWEKRYEYRVVVAAAAKVPDGSTVSFVGDTSAPIEVFAHDVFPPAIPTGVQAVYAGAVPGQAPAVDLTWNPDTDRDLAGYFVYRRKQEDPPSAAVKLNAQAIPAPAYRDPLVLHGETYVYSVSAVDERGNESKRSEETTEEVPR
jgi:hypothetical protein